MSTKFGILLLSRHVASFHSKRNLVPAKVFFLSLLSLSLSRSCLDKLPGGPNEKSALNYLTRFFKYAGKFLLALGHRTTLTTCYRYC